ncbi:MAG TPA: hypothetical protein PK390_00140 [Fervidobacterium nodosum]|nr:hypothetical protein [Fervidobacterium nodosum]
MKSKCVNKEEKYRKREGINYIILLNITNVFLILINLITIYLYGFRFQNFLVYLISAAIYYLYRKNLPEIIVFTLSYPLAWLYMIPLKNEEIEDFFNIPLMPEIVMKIDKEALSTLPIKTVLTIGAISERKAVTYDIFAQVTRGINIEQNMKYLQQLLKDPHMDVSLYAGQALEDIENYFEYHISKTKNENTIHSCLFIYNYLRTGILRGALKEKYKLLLMDKFGKVSDRIYLYYEMMYYLTGDINYLLESFKKTKNMEHLRLFVFEKLKRQDYKEARAILFQHTKALVCDISNLISNSRK